MASSLYQPFFLSLEFNQRPWSCNQHFLCPRLCYCAQYWGTDSPAGLCSVTVTDGRYPREAELLEDQQYVSGAGTVHSTMTYLCCYPTAMKPAWSHESVVFFFSLSQCTSSTYGTIKMPTTKLLPPRGLFGWLISDSISACFVRTKIISFNWEPWVFCGVALWCWFRLE